MTPFFCRTLTPGEIRSLSTVVLILSLLTLCLNYPKEEEIKPRSIEFHLKLTNDFTLVVVFLVVFVIIRLKILKHYRIRIRSRLPRGDSNL